MLIDWLLTAVQTLITSVFGILPSLPPMPDPIINAGNWFVATVGSIVGLLRYFYTPVFFDILMVLFIAFLAFEQIYHLTMWILKKIPVVNVK